MSLRVTLMLAVLWFGVTFAIQALAAGDSPRARPLTTARAAVVTPAAPGKAPKLRLAAAATVPALRDPRRPHKPRAPARKVAPPVRRVVVPAPTPRPRHKAKVKPARTAAPPRYVAPAPRPAAPRYVPPAPRPAAPRPAPTAPPASGAFDTTGDSGQSSTSGGG